MKKSGNELKQHKPFKLQAAVQASSTSGRSHTLNAIQVPESIITKKLSRKVSKKISNRKRKERGKRRERNNGRSDYISRQVTSLNLLANGKNICQDKRILSWLKGYKLPFIQKPKQKYPLVSKELSNSEKSQIRSEINHILEIKVIKECLSSNIKICSPTNI
ncbi:unnamed protein product [Psylliodes chrysocephalus]|uniref:Uncharacterized protein n=1 Tax=Psylliodes chrysocephalus TaxID=3402493 RepID=A0A9P0CRH8_9CUCU|nr:unnamed protein product [Psylliodes chrysocephala]